MIQLRFLGLMRSRYSAYCLGDSAYLLATLAPQNRRSDDATNLQKTIDQTRWLGLRVLGSGTDATADWVEFVAFYQSTPNPGQLHEHSRFVRQDGCWYYLDGRILPPLKLHRNAPCYCGSNKKLKKCCGR